MMPTVVVKYRAVGRKRHLLLGGKPALGLKTRNESEI